MEKSFFEWERDFIISKLRSLVYPLPDDFGIVDFILKEENDKHSLFDNWTATENEVLETWSGEAGEYYDFVKSQHSLDYMPNPFSETSQFLLNMATTGIEHLVFGCNLDLPRNKNESDISYEKRFVENLIEQISGKREPADLF